MPRDSFYHEEDNNSFQHNEQHNSTTNLEALIQQYGDNTELLELILRSKVEEDKRRTEEAKLKNKELDLMLQKKLSEPTATTTTAIDNDIPCFFQKSTHSSLFFNSSNLINGCDSRKSDIEPITTTTSATTKNIKPINTSYPSMHSPSPSPSSSISYKRISLPSINSLDPSNIPFQSSTSRLDHLNISSSSALKQSLLMDQNSIYQKVNMDNTNHSAYDTINNSNQNSLKNIEQNQFEKKENYLESNNNNNNNNNNSQMYIPKASTSTLKTKEVMSSSIKTATTKKLLLPQKYHQGTNSNTTSNNGASPIMKRKRREMQPITMIIETKEFPYNDNYQWKNNGNTIHRKNGQKSIYYKCSNSTKNCPVNKTVVFKDNGEYLIKYRGEHLPDCRMIENVRDL
ncbi:unnamed protein product [Cunninghamella echinulata]